ncbi:hypothetical protein DSCW_52060 [Desulfosarcina widdelii]|uniref:Uncharacterized protein n=1 Tax=Desulfosarcina widdelii TaxID=947919 RepID=A0A5K7ZC98_9BACT|nr:hypothetical protein DSCW_52060 [Desulfosarcina widdelii]
MHCKMTKLVAYIKPYPTSALLVRHEHTGLIPAPRGIGVNLFNGIMKWQDQNTFAFK